MVSKLIFWLIHCYCNESRDWVSFWDQSSMSLVYLSVNLLLINCNTLFPLISHWWCVYGLSDWWWVCRSDWGICFSVYIVYCCYFSGIWVFRFCFFSVCDVFLFYERRVKGLLGFCCVVLYCIVWENKKWAQRRVAHWVAAASTSVWSSGMIPALGAGGPGFNPPNRPRGRKVLLPTTTHNQNFFIVGRIGKRSFTTY
jgi:hypothetical protein